MIFFSEFHWHYLGFLGKILIFLGILGKINCRKLGKKLRNPRSWQKMKKVQDLGKKIKTPSTAKDSFVKLSIFLCLLPHKRQSFYRTCLISLGLKLTENLASLCMDNQGALPLACNPTRSKRFEEIGASIILLHNMVEKRI